MKSLLTPVLLLAAALPALAAPPEPAAPYPASSGDWAAFSDLRAHSPALKKILDRGRLVIGTGAAYRSLNAPSQGGAGREGLIIDYGRALAARILGDPDKVEWRSTANLPVDQAVKTVDVILDILPKGKPGDATSKVEFVAEFLRSGGTLLVKRSGNIQSIGDIHTSTRVLYPKSASKDLNWIRSNVPNATYVEFPDGPAAFAALKAGKGDVVTADLPVLCDLASQDPEYSVTSRYVDRPYFSIIAKGDPMWKRYLNEFNEDIRATGAYEALYQKWLYPLGGEMIR